MVLTQRQAQELHRQNRLSQHGICRHNGETYVVLHDAKHMQTRHLLSHLYTAKMRFDLGDPFEYCS